MMSRITGTIQGYGECVLKETRFNQLYGRYTIWVCCGSPIRPDFAATERLMKEHISHGSYFNGNVYFDDDETFALLALMMS